MRQTAFRILALTLALLLASSALMACQADVSVNTNNTDETTADTTTQDTTVATDPVTEPITSAPETDPPATTPPETDPPVTNPPETDPPETDPPQTNPPETDPPETKPVVTDPVETMMPVPEHEVFYPEVSEDERYESHKLSLTDKKVTSLLKIQGRSATVASGITLDWSASAVEFYAYCSGEIKMNFTVSAQEDVLFRVFVDCESKNTVIAKKDTAGTYTMASGLSEGRHLIRILRLTDVETGCVGIMATLNYIEMNGVLTNRPEDKEFMIEFLGDSVTCAVGAKSSFNNYAYADLSYAYKTAQKLDTDYSMVCISGIGTLSGTQRHDDRGDNILTIYDYINHYRTKSVKYTPERTADLVVIATNANDDASPKEKVYKEHVKELIALIKKTHGEDTKIVWIFGMYNSRATIDLYVKQIFKELGGKEAGYYTLQLPRNNDGGDNHPTEEYHNKYAGNLANLIRSENILTK